MSWGPLILILKFDKIKPYEVVGICGSSFAEFPSISIIPTHINLLTF